MGRWQPDARGRLQQAALTLFFERGYDEVTVADIAERAGLTKRSFFNHFADKPEVVFANVDGFTESVLAALADAEPSLGPLDAAAWAFRQAGAAMMADYPDLARARQRLIESSAELRERDLMKNAAVVAAVADALCQRGVPRRQAAFAAQAAAAVFLAGTDEWSADPGPGLGPAIERALVDLRSALAPAPVPSA